jgi:hypothetical protein
LPDSIRFWKARIEEADADKTFSVGLIYGPSGCGKSSLVKAGLLPRVSEHIISVYAEATADETEARLLRGLRKRCPGLCESVSLTDTLAALRLGRCLRPGKKVVIVLDQFEQWLHAKRNEQITELVQALRQCDGGRLQAIVMVRDDFWLAVSRFLKVVEVDIVEGKNLALVDLFDQLHARKVLSAFGQAYGRLPENLSQCSNDQEAFLDQAGAGLSEDGKVISVRLALFAEMMKGKPWTAVPGLERHLGLAQTAACSVTMAGPWTTMRTRREWAANYGRTSADWWTCTATFLSGVTICGSLRSLLIRAVLEKATPSWRRVDIPFEVLSFRPPQRRQPHGHRHS